MAKEVKQLADITYFPLKNVNKHNFFDILSPQSILVVPSFPRQYCRPMIKSSMSKCRDFEFVAINWFLKGWGIRFAWFHIIAFSQTQDFEVWISGKSKKFSDFQWQMRKVHLTYSVIMFTDLPYFSISNAMESRTYLLLNLTYLHFHLQSLDIPAITHNFNGHTLFVLKSNY